MAATWVRVVLCAWRVVPRQPAALARSLCHLAHLQVVVVVAAAACRSALAQVRAAQAVRYLCLLAVCLVLAVSAVQCHLWRAAAMLAAVTCSL